MKLFFKRTLSVIMVLTMVMGLVPMAFATDNASQTGVDFGLQSSNSFGGILTEEMQTNAGAGDVVNPDDPYALIDVHVIDKTAYVEYRAQEDSTIVVGIYTEEGKLVGSGKEEAMSEYDKCVVDLDVANLPQYFVVKVFLLDSNKAARCPAMTCKTYTKAYQDFFSKEVSDFPDNVVINLDEDETNNFVVLEDGIVEIYASKSKNLLKATSEESASLTIENIDSSVKALKPGNVVYYEFGDGEDDFYLFKVVKVTVNGDEAVIEIDTPELEECFEYIRIEKNVTTSDEYVDVDTKEPVDKKVETNSLLHGQSIFSLWIAQIPEVTVGPSFHFEIDEDNDDDDDDDSGFGAEGSVDGTLDIKVNVTFKFYYFFDLFDADYLDFKLVFNTTIEVGITIEGSVSYTIPLKEISVPIFAGVEAVGQPKFIVEASGSIFIGYTFEKQSGFTKYCDEPKKIINESDSDFKPEIYTEIKIKVGVEIDFGVKAIKVLYAKVIVEAGVEGSGKIKENFLADKKHLCPICIEVNANLYASFGGDVGVEFKIDFLDVDEKFTIVEVKPLYVTAPLYKGYASNYYGSLKLYEGECPHYAYRITFHVVDKDGKAISGASVGSLVTDSSGMVSDFYENEKSFNLSVSADGYIGESVSFKVNDKPVTIRIELEKEDDEEEDPVDPSDPGGTVGNISWHYNQATKTLTLTGSGNMQNYSANTAPWHQYYEEMECINVGSGITSIGNYSFYQCREVSSLSIPDTITSIGMAAFYGCNSLPSIVIGDKVKTVGNYAFFDCYQANSLTIGSSVETIGMYAFAQCENVPTVILPASVKSVGEAAFKACHALGAIKFNNGSCSIHPSENTIPATTVIYGSSGSTAQTYAKNNNRSFIATYGVKTASIVPYSDADGLNTQSASSKYYATASGAIEGEEYVLIVIKKNASFTPANLLYIDQKNAEKSGDITFTFIPKDNSNCEAYVIGKFSNSNQITVNPQLADKPVMVTVSKLPSKTSYIYKESAVDLSGIVLTAVYYDGSTEEITDTTLIDVVSFSTSSVGDQTVVIEYGGMEAEYEIEVSYAWWQWIIRILLLGFIWY